jgi:glycosyltransferase involved in cell wall biosynthesis
MVSIVIISKDEPALGETLARVGEQARALDGDCELIVVDASRGRLDELRRRYAEVRWIDFEPPRGVGVSIPHQRNAGVREARGEIVVFTDAGCVPREGWLERLLAPILDGCEQVTSGPAPSGSAGGGIYDAHMAGRAHSEYLSETPTINLAFRKAAFQAVGGFDERFAYGSDVDFSWRLADAGFRIRNVQDAVVEHDWESGRRQLRRAYQYGRGRARLYLKHRRRLGGAWRRDPVVFAYPAFLLGLPLALRFPAYPLLLLLPAWRNRENGSLRVLGNHLAFGAGVLREVASA